MIYLEMHELALEYFFLKTKNFNEFHPERKRKKNIFKLRSRFETLFSPSQKFWLFTAFLPFWQNSWPVKASFVIKYSSIPYFCHFLGLEKEKGTTMVCLKKLRKSELCERSSDKVIFYKSNKDPMNSINMLGPICIVKRNEILRAEKKGDSPMYKMSHGEVSCFVCALVLLQLTQ